MRVILPLLLAVCLHSQTTSVRMIQLVHQRQCEDGVRSYPGEWIAPGLFVMFSCENFTGLPYQITRFRCRSDVAGQICDLQTKGTDGLLHSLLVTPVVSTPEGAEGSVLKGASYPDGGVLWWSIRIVAPTNPSATLVSQVNVTAAMEQ
jgi:hypothetical protein